ncbi:hypothetical protein MNBD_ALPHA03-427 [hydrothermal vent metagenome]|uniref:DUF4917 domain-containing protein n=1 Tax=hydrothermal vent metagenome TaxID=652676 RepID=A0A3B1AF32_9ZZZZ
MLDIITFQEAINRSEGRDKSLLMGNGFSIEHFSYSNLLDEAGIEDGMPLKALFNELDTYDFETVIRALEDAVIVTNAYDHNKQSVHYQTQANQLREALVHAVRSTHPNHRADIEEKIPSCLRFLKNFNTLYTLNYDLLLYWVQLQSREFSDGFGLGDEERGFIGPFKEGAYCTTYNLHGGLHLFKKIDGEIEKKLMGVSGIIDAIASAITRGRRLPVYIAEGTSPKKMGKINSIPYLRHAYDTLSKSTGDFFVFGHSGDQNDEHIYRAIFRSEIDHLYFCIHQPSADIAAINGELARYKRRFGSNIEYTFVCSESANVWNSVEEEER